MAKLNKTRNGLIFYDDFSEQTLMWTLSPSDANCLAFGENGLQIKHTKHYNTYTIVEPSVEEYSCIVHLDHTPVNDEDIAGIIVLSNAKEYAECQSYLAKGPSELVNSEDYDIDVINKVHDLLTDSYVMWSENEEEPTPINPNVNEEIKSAFSFVDISYPYIKFNKNKYKYMFYASHDCVTWIEIGNVEFSNSGVIGFFIYGSYKDEILNSPGLNIKSFALYNSKYVTIDGISRIYDCEMTDQYGNIIFRTDTVAYAYMMSRSSKRILFNVNTIPMPIRGARLRIYPKRDYETTIAEYSMAEDIYGGDAFVLENHLDLYINGQRLDPLKIYDLGEFYSGNYFVKVEIHNHEEFVVGDIHIKVIRYSEYYGGEEEVGLAYYENGLVLPPPDLEYKKEIVINSIAPSEGRSFYMKLLDIPVQDFYAVANAYRFKIVIE